MKKCLNCDKEIVLEPTTNQYLISNFRLKKFCSKECRIRYNNIKNIKQYLLKETEHNIKVKILNEFVKGKIYTSSGKKNSYNPDLIKEDIDYELELFRNMHKLKVKVDKWDKSRKHVLILSISDQTKTLFDEVYFLNQDKVLIKEK